MKRIKDKIEQIKLFLDELELINPKDFKEYSNSIEKKAACERYVEKIVEAVTDLAFLTIKKEKFRLPESDTDAFNSLKEKNIISEELCSKLKQAKGMRNIIAHEYGTLDDEIIFEAITKELSKDIQEFLKLIKKSKL